MITKQTHKLAKQLYYAKSGLKFQGKRYCDAVGAAIRQLRKQEKEQRLQADRKEQLRKQQLDMAWNKIPSAKDRVQPQQDGVKYIPIITKSEWQAKLSRIKYGVTSKLLGV